MESTKEDELTKLRRAIESQRLKVEKGTLHQDNGDNSRYAMSVGNHPNHRSGTPKNTVMLSELDNIHSVYSHLDQDNVNCTASPMHESNLALSSRGSSLTRNNGSDIGYSDSSLNKRVSSGSLSSVISHMSGSSSTASSGSGPDIDCALKQGKKKRWQFPLKSTSSKGSKSRSSSHPDLLDSEDSGCPVSPTLKRREFNTYGRSGSTADSYTIEELLQVIREKEKKLTDVRLEALTSQHQIIQYKEQINQLQNDMRSLRAENERLRSMVDSNSHKGEMVTSPMHNDIKSPDTYSMNSTFTDDRPLRFNGSIAPPTSFSSRYQHCVFRTQFDTIDYECLQKRLSPDSESDGFQVRFIVTSSSSMLPGRKSVVIGSVPVPRRATWEELDSTTEGIFLEYCRVIDGSDRLGLSASSIEFYHVGNLRRDIGGKIPDLLPCAYIVGDVDSVEIKLKDGSQRHLDQMAFDMLISRDALDCYVTMILQQKRTVLEGPAGTGKRACALSLAEHVVSRLRTELTNTMVTVLDAREEGGEKILNYASGLTLPTDKEERRSIPAVLVIENLHLLPCMSVFDKLMKVFDNDASPYIIVTTESCVGVSSLLHHNFKVVSCACESPHVQPFLTRALRRSLVQHILSSAIQNTSENGKLSSIVLWIALCWQHINRFLSGNNLLEASIGPAVFLSAPMNMNASCQWFVHLWNNSIAPRINSTLANISPKLKANEDPMKWIVNSFPWDYRETGINPGRHLSRIENLEVHQLPRLPISPTSNEQEVDYMDLPSPPPPLPPLSPLKSLRHTFGSNNNSPTTETSKMRHFLYSGSGYRSPTHVSKTMPRRLPNSPRCCVAAGDESRIPKISDNSGNTYDPLKSMLAELKQAALSEESLTSCN